MPKDKIGIEMFRWTAAGIMLVIVLTTCYQCSEQHHQHELACIEAGADRWCDVEK